jgi:hypothetical protein
MRRLATAACFEAASESERHVSDPLLAASAVDPQSSVNKRGQPLQRHDDLHCDIRAAFIRQQANHHAISRDPRSSEPFKVTLRPSPSDAAAASHGTVRRMRNGLTRSVEEEFKGTAFETDYNYVVYGKACDTAGHSEWSKSSESKWKNRLNMIRDKGHEGWTLEDYARLPRVRAAGLTMAEVAMLRIYPTAGRMLNTFLRQQETDGTLQGLEQWATSISVLTSAIIKLSAQAAIQPIYRAIPSAVLDNDACDDGFFSCGFVHFDHAFSSSTQNVDVTLNYAGHPAVPALVFCIDPSWTSRCAALRELSQYPEEDEDLLPPCTSLEITRITTVGCKKLLQCTPHLCTMRHYTDNLLFPWSSPNDPLTAAELEDLARFWGKQLAEKNKLNKPVPGAQQHGKYSSTAIDFVLGEPVIAALGLEDYMKQGFADYWVHPNSCEEALAAIEKEFRTHGTDEDREWFEYITKCAASERVCAQGIRDHNRKSYVLADFAASKEATIAHLNLAHVLALRLYTSPAFKSLNIPLRTYKRDAEGNVLRPPEMNAPHSFPITVLYIREAISKLRAAESILGTQGDLQVMWRGNKDLVVSKDHLSRGGVETSIISTSLSLETAVRYSFSERPVIFKIITRSFMERGAFLEWVSVFPGERECCFPPLTFFSPTGRHQRVKLQEGCSATVIEFTPRL